MRCKQCKLYGHHTSCCTLKTRYLANILENKNEEPLKIKILYTLATNPEDANENKSLPKTKKKRQKRAQVKKEEDKLPECPMKDCNSCLSFLHPLVRKEASWVAINRRAAENEAAQEAKWKKIEEAVKKVLKERAAQEEEAAQRAA